MQDAPSYSLKIDGFSLGFSCFYPQILLKTQKNKQELQDAEKRLDETVNIQSVINRLEDFTARVDRRLDNLSWDEQRQLIRILVARVEIDDEGATIIYRVPGSTDHNNRPTPAEFNKEKTNSDKSIQLSGGSGASIAGECVSSLRV